MLRDIKVGDAEPQRVIFEMFDGAAPKTVENFLALCAGTAGMCKSDPTKPLSYKGSGFHRIIPNFMCQGEGLPPVTAPVVRAFTEKSLLIKLAALLCHTTSSTYCRWPTLPQHERKSVLYHHSADAPSQWQARRVRPGVFNRHL